MVIYFIFLVFIFFASLLFLIWFLVGVCFNPYYNNNTSYECGFSSVGHIQSCFSVQYYFLMCLFIVFDAEIVFLLSFVSSDLSSVILFLLFFFLIYLGYYLECYFGAFKWVN